jgi:hypothetical protein
LRPATIRLIDLGMHEDFGLAMSFAQNMIQSLVARSNGTAPAEIEFIRTRDPLTVKTALQHRAHVIHITAHGDTDPDHLGFWSDDERTGLTLTDLAERFATDGEGVEAAVLFADCCRSATGRWVRAVRDCIEQETVYIGARRDVSWHESTTFASAFYGAFFKDKGFGMTAVERGLSAGERAVKGYEAIVAGECPFKVEVLQPSRVARHNLSLE